MPNLLVIKSQRVPFETPSFPFPALWAATGGPAYFGEKTGYSPHYSTISFLVATPWGR